MIALLVDFMVKILYNRLLRETGILEQTDITELFNTASGFDHGSKDKVRRKASSKLTLEKVFSFRLRRKKLRLPVKISKKYSMRLGCYV